jgi:hypothetical protein
VDVLGLVLVLCCAVDRGMCSPIPLRERLRGALHLGHYFHYFDNSSFLLPVDDTVRCDLAFTRDCAPTAG